MLLRIDENVHIDMSYITCAEYQLFIDEKLKADEHCQPDHWKSYRFPPGDAQKPITGVRSSDAKEFCEWLTQQQSAPIFKYRLPTVAEVKEHPVTEKQVGGWCFDGKQRIIAGIETRQQQTWQQKLAEVLVLKLNRDSDLNRDLNRDLKRDLYRDLYRDFMRDLNRDLNRFLYCDFHCVINCDLNDELYRDLHRVLDRDLHHDLYRVLYQDLYRFLNRDLNRDLYGKVKAIEAGKASDFLLLNFPLLPVIVIYYFLLATYEVISKNQAALNTINLSSQESEVISRKYLQKLNEIYPLYVFLVLLDERQAGRMPAWESIRIVRERVE
ncbi:SUMF1/EgtB/PvdO family nonheme iron enzyme [Microcoleus sp. OTE_8_concoct_300]|uniref:SUMF1/EgtB/PvdO family nonheme iron enzyme n=1 Tax=Microcoleus sp. OTE_8_concoct_300 TaxID=2964710 RepID=UPI00403EF99C